MISIKDGYAVNGDPEETSELSCAHCHEPQSWRIPLTGTDVIRRCKLCKAYTQLWSFQMYVIGRLDNIPD